jgi:hypothetical protein
MKTRTLLGAAVAAVLACWVALMVAAPAQAAPGDLVKVFVVADPGQTLQSVAQDTLGDGGRAGEIFTLNKGRPQPDGTALTDPNQPLHPGWVLKLPDDASGPDVKQARETGTGQAGNAQPGGAQAAPAESSTTSTVVTFPLAAAIAVVVAVLLAFVTAGILGRRRVAGWSGQVLGKLGEAGRRRRLLTQRRALAQRFAADGEAVRRAYETIGEAAVAAKTDDGPVHAVRLDQTGASVWLSASDTLSQPWEQVDSTQWRRPANGSIERLTPAQMPRARAEQSIACLVRAGSDAAGEPIFVDLTRLDGVLSVAGDRTVARDIVQNLLGEVARLRPDLPVFVFPVADAGPQLIVPPGLKVLPQVPMPQPGGESSGPVRGTAARNPVRGLIIAAGNLDERETADLIAFCGSRGGGWTGLVCGDVGAGAHWQWRADADGTVDIPVLGVDLTVPA